MGIQWNQCFAIGVPEVDNQHKELFCRVSSLLGALSQGKGKQEVGNTIRFLEEYIIKHFADEEELMKAHSYPGLVNHKLEHILLMEDFARIRKNLETEGACLPLLIEIQRRLVDWLTNHIARSDKKIGEYINRKDNKL